MSYKLFIDDERIPYVPEEWDIARSSEEAKEIIKTKGMPKEFSLDHDLGGFDTVMIFLKWLAHEFWNGENNIPEYRVHSANVVGKENIIFFMESWKKSVNL